MIQLILVASASAALIATATLVGQNAADADFMASHYPPGALAKGEDGRVGFEIALRTDGYIERCAVTQSSGFATLDRETCDFIVQFLSFQAVRDAAGKNRRSLKTGFIDWKLPPGAQRSSAPRVASLKLPPALVCKRVQLTGSNVASAIHCMTEPEWKLQEQVMRDDIDAVQGRVFCGDHPGCGN